MKRGLSNRCPDLEAGLNKAQESAPLCALVLAGGEGKRLRPFIHLLRRDLLPKQYVNFIGRRSMLEHTWARAEKLSARSHVFTIVNRSHLAFPEVKRQIASRQPGTVLIQPDNKETAPGIIFALFHIAKRYPDSVVALLPSDHFVFEEDEMIGCLRRACAFVKREPSRIVLLGIEPDHDESEYGYIVTGCSGRRGTDGPLRISSFVEKPDCDSAQKLTRAGALWNTMMTVFKISTLFDLVSVVYPSIFRLLKPIYHAIDTPDEEAVTAAVYQELPPVNFSKGILEPMARDYSSRLVAFPVRNVLWSDWGSETRIMEVLRKIGHQSRLHGLSRQLNAAHAPNDVLRAIDSSPRIGDFMQPSISNPR